MGIPNKKFFKMSDRNSSPDDQNSAPSRKTGDVEIDTLTTPESLQQHFGIGKSAYYDDIRFLRAQGHPINTHRDEQKRTIVAPETVQLLTALRAHVAATGSREGFKYGGGLAVMEDASLGHVAEEEPTPTPEYETASGSQLDDMVRQAQQLAAHNLVMGNRVITEMARQISYDDLPEDLKQQVDQARAATAPKVNPAEVANSLLSRWRASQGSGHQSGALV